ncbi:MAG: type II secretion system F family protein [Actinomycetota bacterium]
MTWVLLLGGAVGFGLCCIAFAFRAPLPGLVEELARLGPARARGEAPNRNATSTTLALLSRVGPTPHHVAGDLRLLGQRSEALAVQRLGVGLLGAVFALVSTTAMDLSGVPLPLGVRLGLLVVLAVGGSVVPVVTLRSQAAERRRQARQSLAVFLDLAAVALSAGAGAEEALFEAADAAQGAGFTELRDALHRAQRSGETPWGALHRLGGELGLPELSDLAATMRLVGTEGARARATLLARSRTLRRTLVAESEARGNRRAEASRVPLALQFVAFLVLVVYPPLLRLLGGF